jgi:hypothetical protein
MCTEPEQLLMERVWVLQTRFRRRLCVRHNRTDILVGNPHVSEWPGAWGNASAEAASGGIELSRECREEVWANQLEYQEFEGTPDGMIRAYWTRSYEADV